ncbi:hypothetical protein ES703_39922 [subsurface metagenome]
MSRKRKNSKEGKMKISLIIKNKEEIVGKCKIDNLTAQQIERLLKYIHRLEMEKK